jgi:hypothetical protein
MVGLGGSVLGNARDLFLALRKRPGPGKHSQAALNATFDSHNEFRAGFELKPKLARMKSCQIIVARPIIRCGGSLTQSARTGGG